MGRAEVRFLYVGRLAAAAAAAAAARKFRRPLSNARCWPAVEGSTTDDNDNDQTGGGSWPRLW